MPFTQPYTYLDGVAVGSTDQEANDNEALRYVGQGILVGDLAANSLGRDEIQRGRLALDAFLGPVAGVQWVRRTDWERERDWLTYQVKGGTQTSNKQYREVEGTALQVRVPQGASMLLTGLLSLVAAEVDTSIGTGTLVSGKLEQEVWLVQVDPTGQRQLHPAPTRLYAFEETTSAAVGKDPGNVVNNLNARRLLPVAVLLTGLAAGLHRFAIGVDPTVYHMYAGARNMVAELFYV